MNKQAIYLLIVTAILFATCCKKDDNADSSKPFIVLQGANPFYWSEGLSPYQDPGAEAWDITDTNDTINISDRLQVSDNVDVNTIGDYNVKFNVTDEAGNSADEMNRLVKVVLTK